MPGSYLPLSWESTGDQWWYATPIDWAAANGLCDLVKELLCIDPNLLIKLTSLRRTRRLETVWDDSLGTTDDGMADNGVARSRARVARSLLMDCEPKHGDGGQVNSLMRAGYGGWLLYTAASAGDLSFVKDLLERDPLIVFGEGEYGVTDILYAAARSKDSGVFRLVFESAMDANKGGGEVGEGFVEEMMSRAVHAAARGGNLEVLKELLLDCSDVLSYRDGQGFTILHSASSRGQLEVVKELIATCSGIVNSTDYLGNTALHVAAYRGYSSVVEVLALKSPSLIASRNKNGDTFLHMAVAGFRSPGFHRIDQQSELIKQLTSGAIINLENVINIQNHEGRTALHIAVAENIQCNVVELLMRVPSINIDIRDNDGFTPLNLFKQCPETPKSNLLTKQLTSVDAISDCQEKTARSSLARHLRVQGIGTSPGTSFRLPDSELFPLEDNDNDSDVSFEKPSNRFSSFSREITSNFDSDSIKRSSSINSASRRLKFLLQFPRGSDKTSSTKLKDQQRVQDCQNVDDNLTPLRQKYLRALHPSHSAREKFTASLMQGVMQGTPPKSCFPMDTYSPFGSFSRSLASSPSFVENPRGVYECKSVGRSKFFSGPLGGDISLVGDSKHRRGSSFSKSLMNQYFCFGAQGLAVEDSNTCTRTNSSCRRLVF